MPITLDQIVEKPCKNTGELAAAWKTETDRRIAEIEAGKIQGVPLEESLARARMIADSKCK